MHQPESVQENKTLVILRYKQIIYADQKTRPSINNKKQYVP